MAPVATMGGTSGESTRHNWPVYSQQWKLQLNFKKIHKIIS